MLHLFEGIGQFFIVKRTLDTRIVMSNFLKASLINILTILQTGFIIYIASLKIVVQLF